MLDDPKAAFLKTTAERLILCSGKIFVDLIESKFREANEETAIARIEQLYPFPASEIKSLIKSYTRVEEVIWVQEEPQNMGAWNYVRPLLADILGDKLNLRYIGRSPNASPAEGSMALHASHHMEVIENAFRSGLAKEGAAQVKAANTLLNS